MKDFTMKKEMPISEIAEHPRNKEYFTDIKDSNPAFWLEFVDSIKRFGIIEPILVNQSTKYIRSGNQRYKAAIELGFETVPVVLVDDSASDNEISEMIASNVFRRQIDPFKLFDYIAELRKGSSSVAKPGTANSGLPSNTAQNAAQTVHKKTEFVSAADIWHTFTEDQKEELR